ncbi:MAG: NfeD family protein [Betaproteobacteria bacterium]|jgi:membrane protein implicated in regulation of membrane protease activity|nr:NfeD family protein [Betaproteobacteria bacterium]
MCHLVLALPFLALPVFWLLPEGEAVALYVLVLGVTGAVYWLAVRAMRAPVVVGIGTLLRAIGTVRATDGRKASVWVGSELWSAEPQEGALAVGDVVEVVGFEGLRLIVKKVLPAAGASEESRPARN